MELATNAELASFARLPQLLPSGGRCAQRVPGLARGRSAGCSFVQELFSFFNAHMSLFYVGLDALFRLAHDEANQTQLGAAGAVSA